jgi:hypothetical protein
MDNLPAKALHEALDALATHGIAAVLTGSFAAAYHGVVRATHDADLKVAAEGLEAKLPALHEDLRRRGFRILDDTTFTYFDRFDVELYPADNALDREAVARAVRGTLGALGEVRIVAVEDLLLIKAREYSRTLDHKHIDDARKLVVANRAALDAAYLQERLRRHRLEAAWALVEPRGRDG